MDDRWPSLVTSRLVMRAPDETRPRRRQKKHRRGPVPVAEVVGKAARRWRFLHLHRLEVIRRAWREAAGEFVAKHAIPVRLVRRTLRVSVEDSSWVNEMTYLGPEILERLKERLKGNWVTDLKVVVGEPAEDLPSPPPAFVLPPATPALEHAAEALAEDVEDPALRAAVARAALAYLRRKAGG
jgi:hypothetical protein